MFARDGGEEDIVLGSTEDEDVLQPLPICDAEGPVRLVIRDCDWGEQDSRFPAKSSKLEQYIIDTFRVDSKCESSPLLAQNLQATERSASRMQSEGVFYDKV